eukprot:TRINITY_DN974_c0_g1_i1.p1 TRINITY_DN974_c0_g1~~TRINITY_DN974_c0_g1_i1.p1  ORF type:complete len:1778 (+),score=528.80 TRINITY_DN974_c0_g1_i1:132-5465(+)
MSSRLDRLFDLLEGKCDLDVKVAAAKQIGELSRSIDAVGRQKWLRRVFPLFVSDQWDVRHGAEACVRAIARHMPQYHPGFSEKEPPDSIQTSSSSSSSSFSSKASKMASTSFMRVYLSFDRVDLMAIVREGTPLYADQVRDEEAPVLLNAEYQRKKLVAKIGMDRLPDEVVREIKKMISDKDLEKGAPSQLVQEKSAKTGVESLLANGIDENGKTLNAREKYRLKRMIQQQKKKSASAKSGIQFRIKRSRSSSTTDLTGESASKKRKKESPSIKEEEDYFGGNGSEGNGEDDSENDDEASGEDGKEGEEEGVDDEGDEEEEINVDVWPFDWMVERSKDLIFHEKWEVRHGAVLCLLACLRHHSASMGFSCYQRNEEERQKEHELAEEDVCIRLLCILALDRLSDFSTTQSVAPVRELAAQAAAILCKDGRLFENAWKPLVDLCTYAGEEWQVPHGSLQAVKYILALREQYGLDNDRFILDIAPIIPRRLDDPVDDVASVTAEIVSAIKFKLQTVAPDFFSKTFVSLWSVMEKADATSALLGPGVKLIADFLEVHDMSSIISAIGSLSNVFLMLSRQFQHPIKSIRVGSLKALLHVLRKCSLKMVLDRKASMFLFRQVVELFAREEERDVKDLVFEVSQGIIDMLPEEAVSEMFIDMYPEWQKVFQYPLGTRLDSIFEELYACTGDSRSENEMRMSGRPHFEGDDERLRCLEDVSQWMGRACLRMKARNMIDTLLGSLAGKSAVGQMWACLALETCMEFVCSKEEWITQCFAHLQETLELQRSIVIPEYVEVGPFVSYFKEEVVKFVKTMKRKKKRPILDETSHINDYRRVIKRGVLSGSEGAFREAKGAMGRFGSEKKVLDEQVLLHIRCTLCHLGKSADVLVRILSDFLGAMEGIDGGSYTCRRVSLATAKGLYHLQRIDTVSSDGIMQGLLKTYPSLAATGSLRELSKIVGHGIFDNYPSFRSETLEILEQKSPETSLLDRALSIIYQVLENLETDVLQTLVQNHLPHIFTSCSLPTDVYGKKCLQFLANTDAIGPNVMHQLVTIFLPLASSSIPETRRAVALTLRTIVESMGLKILPYSVFLVRTLMNHMIDPDEATRLVCSHTFGLLVRILPLESSIPDAIGFEDMADVRARERKFLQQLLDSSKVDHYEMPIEVESVKMRKYQEDGVSWLAFLRNFGLNGILADDMGLGKTLQAICIMASDTHERGELKRKHLVVCPATLVTHWIEEITRFCPKTLIAESYAGPIKERKIRQSELGEADVIVTSYDVARSDVEFLGAFAFSYLILDEGQAVRNPKSKVSLAVRRFHAEHKLILSGTPIQNHVDELWALFDFLMPGFLGSETDFRRVYGKPIASTRFSKKGSKERERGTLALDQLHRQVLPFVLRRMKHDVLSDLPPRIIQDVQCEMSDVQMALYEDFHNQRESSGDIGSGASANHIFQVLHYLRKLCSHPKLVLDANHPLYYRFEDKVDTIESSSKLVALEELLIECGIGLKKDENGEDGDDVFGESATGGGEESGHRALIFVQNKAFLDIVEHDLFRQRMPTVSFLRLDGNVEASKRQSVVTRFNQDPTIDVLLLTTHVGGLGLNLTGADTVIFLEHDWNPQKDLQAMDRAHRLGQKRTVNVYRLITKDTLEEKIMGLQRFKLSIANSIVNEENMSVRKMSTTEITSMFKSEQDRLKSKRKGGGGRVKKAGPGPTSGGGGSGMELDDGDDMMTMMMEGEMAEDSASGIGNPYASIIEGAGSLIADDREYETLDLDNFLQSFVEDEDETRGK